jgi:hypothetical protein
LGRGFHAPRFKDGGEGQKDGSAIRIHSLSGVRPHRG